MELEKEEEKWPGLKLMEWCKKYYGLSFDELKEWCRNHDSERE